jgi:hypothetical protein
MIDMQGITLLPGVSALFELLISPRMFSYLSSNLFIMMQCLSDGDIRLVLFSFYSILSETGIGLDALHQQLIRMIHTLFPSLSFMQ